MLSVFVQPQRAEKYKDLTRVTNSGELSYVTPRINLLHKYVNKVWPLIPERHNHVVTSNL